MFHAMVSVTAVKIQLSSPRGVRRELRWPGILSIISIVIPVRIVCVQNQRKAILMGVVRHDVNMSACEHD